VGGWLGSERTRTATAPVEAASSSGGGGGGSGNRASSSTWHKLKQPGQGSPLPSPVEHQARVSPSQHGPAADSCTASPCTRFGRLSPAGAAVRMLLLLPPRAARWAPAWAAGPAGPCEQCARRWRLERHTELAQQGRSPWYRETVEMVLCASSDLGWGTKHAAAWPGSSSYLGTKAGGWAAVAHTQHGARRRPLRLHELNVNISAANRACVKLWAAGAATLACAGTAPFALTTCTPMSTAQSAT